MNQFLQDYDKEVTEKFKQQSMYSKTKFDAIQESFKSLNQMLTTDLNSIDERITNAVSKGERVG